MKGIDRNNYGLPSFHIGNSVEQVKLKSFLNNHQLLSMPARDRTKYNYRFLFFNYSKAFVLDIHGKLKMFYDFKLFLATVTSNSYIHFPHFDIQGRFFINLITGGSMRKPGFFTALLFLIMIIAGGSSFAQTVPSEIVLVNEFVGQVEFVQGRVTQLLEAMPQSTYDWRPAEGVRSVGEVYLHIAFANYICVTVSGGEVPEETGFVMDFEKINEWDTQTNDKSEIKAKMVESFDFLKKRVGNLTEDDLNREVEVFGMKMSVRNFMISMIAHCHEHLGQSIAYARSNEITPPWSMGEN